STSALMFFTHSGLSIWLSIFTWIATMVLPCWSADATLVMAIAALGLLRLESTITAIRIATITPATSRGTMGGSVHLALSNSSVMGICPASGRLAGAVGVAAGLASVWPGSGGGGVALSDISGSRNSILF